MATTVCGRRGVSRRRGFCLPGGGRHEIATARIPRMAFAQALGRQQAAKRRAMQHNRFRSVTGTGRVKTAAGTKERTEAQLVSADQQQQDFFHDAETVVATSAATAVFIAVAPDWSNCVSSSRNAILSVDVTAGPLLALTGLDSRTMQSTAGSTLWRNSSRVARLTALRVTARGASRLETTTPRRALASPLARAYNTKCTVR